MSLAARQIEAAGIATVIVGSALDIVTWCGVPRFLFTDFPLGNPSGHPFDAGMQRAIVAQALGMLDTVAGPRTVVRAPFEWRDDPGWRERYGRVAPEEVARLRALGEERKRRQAEARALKQNG